MKYNVGDKVKLRDDLEVDKFYKGIKFIYEMERLKYLPIELFEHEIFDNCYKVEDYNGKDYIVSEAMIEGLWEECKGITYEPYKERANKYKLIDILNKIANGELKEGTKVKWRDNIYDSGYELFSDVSMVHLNDEVELIEPQEPKECEHEWKEYGVYNIETKENKYFRKCIKCDLEEEIKPNDNTTKKIEELDILEIEDNQNIDNIGLATSIGDLRNEIREIQHKLNEVIRKINKED